MSNFVTTKISIVHSWYHHIHLAPLVNTEKATKQKGFIAVTSFPIKNWKKKKKLTLLFVYIYSLVKTNPISKNIVIPWTYMCISTFELLMLIRLWSNSVLIWLNVLDQYPTNYFNTLRFNQGSSTKSLKYTFFPLLSTVEDLKLRAPVYVQLVCCQQTSLHYPQLTAACYSSTEVKSSCRLCLHPSSYF